MDYCAWKIGEYRAGVEPFAQPAPPEKLSRFTAAISVIRKRGQATFAELPINRNKPYTWKLGSTPIPGGNQVNSICGPAKNPMRLAKYLLLSISVWLAVLANNAYSAEDRAREVTESARLRLAAKLSRLNPADASYRIIGHR
jgi:hypothetical protein